MYSASRSIRAVALLIVCNLSGAVAFPQGVKFIHDAIDPLPFAKLPVGMAACTGEAGNALANAASAPCDTTPVSVPSVNPCPVAKTGPWGCDAPRDLVAKDLAAMGKPGKKIMRARDRVLEILQTENACSEWMRKTDANAAATFRTLDYAVDRHGEEGVHAWREAGSQYTYRDPYVARVGQDTGAYATITLNVEGAFFQPQAQMLVVSKEGGAARISGTRFLNIGPYQGDSLNAQTLALLHEFGHVINLLPSDFDNEGGKSMQNTAEVLRYCRAEIDAKVRRGTLQAAK
jgi:hypothetical protein